MMMLELMIMLKIMMSYVENYDDHDDAGGRKHDKKVSLNCTFSPWESMGAISRN